MRAMGKIGARSPGSIGFLVPGFITGGRGFGRSGRTLYHLCGISFSDRIILFSIPFSFTRSWLVRDFNPAVILFVGKVSFHLEYNVNAQGKTINVDKKKRKAKISGAKRDTGVNILL